eukprot:363371-Chlamydomonas_euryale.AAC.6
MLGWFAGETVGLAACMPPVPIWPAVEAIWPAACIAPGPWGVAPAPAPIGEVIPVAPIMPAAPGV